MEFLQRRIAPLLERVDLLVPEAIRESPSAQRVEELRRARFLLLVVAISCMTAITSSVKHFLEAELAQAAFTTFALLPILFTVVLMQRVGRLEHAVHYLCAILAAAVIASPFFSHTISPIFVGMVAIPVAATAMGGWRVGITWTLVATMIAGAGAAWLPLNSMDRSIAWNTMIIALVCGVGLSITDHMLTRAVDDANAAREKAEENIRIREVAEAALVDSQTLFATAFLQSPTIMQLTDSKTGEILEVSQGFLDLFACSREGAIGSTLIDLGFLPDHETRRRFVAELSDPRVRRDVEIPMKTWAGEDVVLSATAKLLEVAGRRCLLTQAVDITDRKRNDELLAKHRRELELKFAERGRHLKASQMQLRESERLAAVGTLAAGIAHQINNPIGGVIAAAEYALLSTDSPNRERQYVDALETARDEAKRCGRIVKSVLKFARDEPTPKWIEDLNPIVRRTCQLARTYVEDRGGVLTIETAAESLPVRVSPIDLEQVVLNLVRNAAESRTFGARVLVETRRMGDFAELLITDDGRGIPKDARSKVFDPFYTTRIGEGGTGLGLSVVHGVVGDHQGRIEIESPLAGGTQFRVMLPIATESTS